VSATNISDTKHSCYRADINFLKFLRQSEHGIVIYPLHRDVPKTQKLEDDRLAIKCLLRKFFFIL
jgi:hypothetical protein